MTIHPARGIVRLMALTIARLVVVALVLAGMSAAAHGQEAEAVDFDFYAWSRLAAGAPPAEVRFGGGLYVSGPLALGAEKSYGEVGAGLAIESLPDRGAFSFADLGTWGNYYELTSHGAYRIGSRTVKGGEVRTYAIAWGGATFASFGPQEPGTIEQRRALRHYAFGFQLEHRSTAGARSWVRAGWGTDEATGPPSWHQLLIEGLVVVKGPVSISARAGVAFGEASLSGAQSDYITAGLRVDIDDLAF